jgi:hypothetical protein
MSADGACATHLKRESDRPISAAAATRKLNASLAEGGGPCKCTSSAYATTLTSGNGWTKSRREGHENSQERGMEGEEQEAGAGGRKDGPRHRRAVKDALTGTGGGPGKPGT